MGSKTQIALPDLRVQDNEPPRRRAKSGQRKVTSADRQPGRRAKKADVIPAFLPETESAKEEPAAATATDQDTDERAEEYGDNAADVTGRSGADAQTAGEAGLTEGDDADDALLLCEEVGVAGEQAATRPVTEDDRSGSEGVTDPELLALLEQLSNTLDNANQVFSESPARLGGIEDEYEAAGAAEARGLTPPPAPNAQPTTRPGRGLGIVMGLLVLAAGGGGYWWLASNPWLLDGRQADNAMTVTPARETVSASVQESVSLKVPIPAVDVPLPPRKPVPGADAAPVEQDSAAVPAEQDDAAVRFAPPSDDEPVAIIELGKAVSAQQEEARSAQPHGPAGSPIALGLSMPENREGLEISIMIQGVPEGARLSAGNRIGGGTWVVEEQDVEQLALVTPASFGEREFELEVAFVKSDGNVPESRSISIVVDPAHAPVTPATHGLAAVDAGKAPPVPAPANVAARGPAPGGTAPKQSPESKTTTAAVESGQPAAGPDEPSQPVLEPEKETAFLDRGAKLLSEGDVAGARLIFEHAARQGSKRAMVQLGRTYDPAQLQKLGVVGVQADINQATAWYERASRKADR